MHRYKSDRIYDMMTFEETTEFLYKQVPVFQHNGASAYKPGLANTEALDRYFEHPHQSFPTIHVGGTNGKGSVSHTLAAILQEAGYRVGLYTSPHLVDFRERIRVNGEMVSKSYVVEFVDKHFKQVEHIRPSFFEFTMMMAFNYFRQEKVDVAIIEVGLGGRLDSTNVITPELSIITNISFDHVQFLGNTLAAIASEKAGIMKKEIPVVIGEADAETRPVFTQHALEAESPIYFAEDNDLISHCKKDKEGRWMFDNREYPELIFELSGDCQIKNTRTLLCALPLLKRKFTIPDQAVYNGFKNVTKLTGLRGRWEKIAESPLTYCDTGHNKGGFSYIIDQLNRQQSKHLRIVIGMVNDKDISGILALLPQHATYYFTRASVPRSLKENELQELAKNYGLSGKAYPSVWEAFESARRESTPEDFIFIGGSNFVVADLLGKLETEK